MKSGDFRKVKAAGMTEEERKALRSARFAAEAAKGAPPIPKRVMAWPGGKISSNKEVARAKFEARQQSATVEAREAHTKLYIGNLSYRTTSKGLTELFPDCISAKIMSEGRKSRGFGFATFPNAQIANEVMATMDGHVFDGRPLSIKPATQRGSQSTKQPRLGWAGNWTDDSKSTVSATPIHKKEVTQPLVEKPLEKPKAEPTVVWKLALKEEAERWRQQGELVGSELDLSDGFWHFADADMVKKVAHLFFSEVNEDLVLLAADPEDLPSDLLWISSEAHSSESELAQDVQTDAIPRLRVFKDGCLHLHAPKPLPFSAFSRSFDLLRAAQSDSSSFIFPPECSITLGPKPQALGDFVVKY